jgi:opacity protein-like surface antigen
MSKRSRLVGIGALAPLCLSILGVTLLHPGVASADEVYERSGVYMVVSGVSAFATFSTEPSVSPESIHSFGFSARLGYRIHPRWAAEAQYEWVNGWDLNRFDTTVGKLDRSNAGSVNGKFYILTDRLQPYATVGLGVASMREHKGGEHERLTNFMVKGGLGMDWYINETVGLNLETTFVAPTGSLSDYHYLALNWGVFLRF